MRGLELDLDAAHLAAIEGDGEAHAGVQQQVVIGVVADIAMEVAGIEAGDASDGLGESRFVVVGAGSVQRQVEAVVVQGDHLRSGRNQEVFPRRCAEYAVVGRVQHQTRAGQAVRDAEPRAEGMLVNQQAVMVEAQAGAEGQAAEPDQILRIGGLLAVLGASVEPQRGRGIGIENAGAVHVVGDDVVAELLAQRCEVAFRADFPVVAAVVAGEAGVEVGFAEAAVLRGGNRGGQRVRPQVGAHIPEHAAHGAEQRG